jgi:hypothetical protein
MPFGYTPPAGSSGGGTGDLVSTNNLSDLTNAGTARTNLGLGTASTSASTAFEAAGNLPVASSMMLNKSLNLSDVTTPATARTNLGLGTMGIRNSGEYLAAGNNLSDLNSAVTARTSLGLTNMSVLNTVPMASGGTGLNTVTGNYLLGGNSDGTAIEAKSIRGGQGISLTHSATDVRLANLNTIASGTGKPFDLSTSNQFYTVLTSGNYALSVVSGTVGQSFRVLLYQDGTGNRTPAWWTTIKWPSSTAPTQSSGQFKGDWYTFVMTDTSIYHGAQSIANL